MSDRIRVLRVLEYEGTRRFVEGSLRSRSVKGVMATQDGRISEAILGEFPETLSGSSVVMRRPVLQEDEGIAKYIASFATREAALAWIDEREEEFFSPSDYYILGEKNA